MAELKMLQICKEIRSRWKDVEGIAMVQRIGKLMPGTVSVVVACSSSHRDSGIFEAARYGIDRLKEIVPIWKKEVSKDGEEWMEGEYFPHTGRMKPRLLHLLYTVKRRAGGKPWLEIPLVKRSAQGKFKIGFRL